jgi:hypothetical protein
MVRHLAHRGRTVVAALTGAYDTGVFETSRGP